MGFSGVEWDDENLLFLVRWIKSAILK